MLNDEYDSQHLNMSLALVIFSQAIIVMLLYYIHVDKVLMEVSEDGSKRCQIDHYLHHEQ